MTTHLNKKNKPKIVNVGNKKITKRIAIAEGKIQFSKKFFNQLKKMETKKGEISSVAIIAGIMGAKKTSDLIPLCHNIDIENIDIDIVNLSKENSLIIQATVNTTGKTGVEMEALTAVSIACLTLYDMCKSIDKSMIIKEIKLLSKKGGKKNYKIK